MNHVVVWFHNNCTLSASCSALNSTHLFCCPGLYLPIVKVFSLTTLGLVLCMHVVSFLALHNFLWGTKLFSIWKCLLSTSLPKLIAGVCVSMEVENIFFSAKDYWKIYFIGHMKSSTLAWYVFILDFVCHQWLLWKGHTKFFHKSCVTLRPNVPHNL